MFEAGDRVREIETGDEGTFVRYATQAEDDGYATDAPLVWISWDCYRGDLLTIREDEIEAVEDAS